MPDTRSAKSKNDKRPASSPELCESQPRKVNKTDERMDKELKDKLQFIIDGQTNFSKQLTTMQQTVNELSNDVKSLGEEMKNIKADVVKVNSELQSAKTEIIQLQNDHDSMSAEINQLRQENFYTHFNLIGLPSLSAEDALPTLKKFASKFGVTLSEKDLKRIFVFKHRSGGTSQISGEFFEVRKRDEVFNKFGKSIAEKKPVIVEDVCNIANDSSLREKKSKSYQGWLNKQKLY